MTTGLTRANLDDTYNLFTSIRQEFKESVVELFSMKENIDNLKLGFTPAVNKNFGDIKGFFTKYLAKVFTCDYCQFYQFDKERDSYFNINTDNCSVEFVIFFSLTNKESFPNHGSFIEM